MDTFKSISRKSAIGIVTILALLVGSDLIPSPYDMVANGVIAVAAYYSISPVTRHKESKQEPPQS